MNQEAVNREYTHDEEGINGFDRWRQRTLQQHEALAQADRQIRAFVIERPFAAVGLALVAGYFVARSINAFR